MSRQLRLQFSGAVYHIMSRGDRRQAIYRDDIDRQQFLRLLGNEVVQQRWRMYAYCLMGNHYHLVLETPEANLVAGMRRLNGVYTQFFNRRHDLAGHVLQGRYRSILVERDSYLLELARYVVLNPVRANLVRRVQDWPWSSYRATAGLVRPQDWMVGESLVRLFCDDLSLARARYQDFVCQGVGAPSPWTQVRGQIFLGSDRFLRDMAARAAQKPAAGVPRQQRFPDRPGADTVLAAVAASFEVEPSAVQGRLHQMAFQAWVYLLRRAANLSLREAARQSGVSVTRVSQIQSAIEADGRSRQLGELLHRYKVKT